MDGVEVAREGHLVAGLDGAGQGARGAGKLHAAGGTFDLVIDVGAALEGLGLDGDVLSHGGTVAVDGRRDVLRGGVRDGGAGGDDVHGRAGDLRQAVIVLQLAFHGHLVAHLGGRGRVGIDIDMVCAVRDDDALGGRGADEDLVRLDGDLLAGDLLADNDIEVLAFDRGRGRGGTGGEGDDRRVHHLMLALGAVVFVGTGHDDGAAVGNLAAPGLVLTVFEAIDQDGAGRIGQVELHPVLAAGSGPGLEFGHRAGQLVIGRPVGRDELGHGFRRDIRLRRPSFEGKDHRVHHLMLALGAVEFIGAADDDGAAIGNLAAPGLVLAVLEAIDQDGAGIVGQVELHPVLAAGSGPGLEFRHLAGQFVHRLAVALDEFGDGRGGGFFVIGGVAARGTAAAQVDILAVGIVRNRTVAAAEDLEVIQPVAAGDGGGEVDVEILRARGNGEFGLGKVPGAGEVAGREGVLEIGEVLAVDGGAHEKLVMLEGVVFGAVEVALRTEGHDEVRRAVQGDLLDGKVAVLAEEDVVDAGADVILRIVRVRRAVATDARLGRGVLDGSDALAGLVLPDVGNVAVRERRAGRGGLLVEVVGVQEGVLLAAGFTRLADLERLFQQADGHLEVRGAVDAGVGHHRDRDGLVLRGGLAALRVKRDPLGKVFNHPVPRRLDGDVLGTRINAETEFGGRDGEFRHAEVLFLLTGGHQGREGQERKQ